MKLVPRESSFDMQTECVKEAKKTYVCYILFKADWAIGNGMWESYVYVLEKH